MTRTRFGVCALIFAKTFPRLPGIDEGAEQASLGQATWAQGDPVFLNDCSAPGVSILLIHLRKAAAGKEWWEGLPVAATLHARMAAELR